MPNLPESPALVYGEVIDVEPVRDFETKKPDGARVLLSTKAPGAPGFSRVRIRLDDWANLAGKATAGSSVAWLIRHGAWSGRTNAGEVFVQFVREATDDDLQAAHEFIQAAARAKS